MEKGAYLGALVAHDFSPP